MTNDYCWVRVGPVIRRCFLLLNQVDIIVRGIEWGICDSAMAPECP